MLVEFLGHAGILLRLNETAIVMDPWFSKEGAFDGSWYQLPSNHDFICRDWSGLEAAIVSHEHLDHLDPEFLKTLAPKTSVLIPRYPSARLFKAIQSQTGRTPRVLDLKKEHAIGKIRMRIWTEESPMNHDSIWAFKTDTGSVLHLVDSRPTSNQLDEILDYLEGSPDLMLVQGAGASWYPMVYENYDSKTNATLSQKKREHKLAFVYQIAKRMQPRKLAINAGPPAFLDPELFHWNGNPIFTTPNEVGCWLQNQGYKNTILLPLPGDSVNLLTAEVTENTRIRKEFSWENTSAYLQRYAKEMLPHIQNVKKRAEAIPSPNLYSLFKEHFEKMLRLNDYFIDKIDMTVCFDIQGEGGGKWLVDFRKTPMIRPYSQGDSYQYYYRLNSRWLKRILVEKVQWEDFFLSLRFAASRNPDQYNDHLLGLMKFNEKAALEAVEQYEKSRSDETIVITTSDRRQYEISKYCPHAGASMEDALIQENTITCLNHHYTFDLETGECLSGNCKLKTTRLA
jgi:UDP-MurNAc hydroxylase